MPKSVAEVFRDFVRFTGDGLPGEPANAPLPVGDPSSGTHNPNKRDMRDILQYVADLPSVPVQSLTGAISAKTYGLTGTAIQSAIDAAAAAGGGTVIVPAGTYAVSQKITLRSRVRVQGVGYPALVFGAAIRMFEGVDIADAEVSGFRVSGAVASGSFVRLENTTGCAVRDNILTGCPSSDNGTIHLFGSTGSEGNEVSGNVFRNCLGNGIGLIGNGCRRNRVDGNAFTDGAGFGVFVAGGAHRNTITRNRTTSNGIELVGVTVGSNHNIVAENHAEGCGDNGISITGNYCAVVGNHCYGNKLTGIFLYGSLNTCTGNVCMRNGQGSSGQAGIAVQPVFGGTGQYNSVTGNVCDDDQATATQDNGIRIMASSYTAWASGQSVTVGTYRLNGIRIYRAATAGTTGATAPTHTSGTDSDGAVTWEAVNAFRVVAETTGNIAQGNVLGRSLGSGFLDQQKDAPGAIPMRARLDAGMAVNRRQVDASTTVTATDYILGVRTTAAITVNLPAAATLEVGRQLVIADEYGAAAANNLTINGNGSQINGAATLVLNTNYAVRHLYWTGSAWSAK